MSADGCQHESPKGAESLHPGRYRRILWAALLANALMFMIEIVAGLMAVLALQGGWLVLRQARSELAHNP